MAGSGVDFAALVALAERVGERLKARGETIAIAESSAGGLISAALLAIPGASAYFVGGAVVYTREWPRKQPCTFRAMSLRIRGHPLKGMRWSWREVRATSIAPPGVWERLAPRGRPGIAMATRPGTSVWPLPGRPSAPSPLRQPALTEWSTWTRSPARPCSFSTR